MVDPPPQLLPAGLRSGPSAPGPGIASGHAPGPHRPRRRLHLRDHGLGNESGAPGIGTGSDACAKRREGGSFHTAALQSDTPSRNCGSPPTLPHQPRTAPWASRSGHTPTARHRPPRVARARWGTGHCTHFLRRRPYSSRRSSLEMGFRCMKLQKPPRVHSLWVGTDSHLAAVSTGRSAGQGTPCPHTHPISYCRQQASRKSVTGDSSAWMGCPLNQRLFKSITAFSASSSRRNCQDTDTAASPASHQTECPPHMCSLGKNYHATAQKPLKPAN